MSANDSATKGDLKVLDLKIEKLDANLQDTVETLLNYIEKEGEKTRQHFDSVAENMFQDICGANVDQLSLMEDKVTKQGKRISRLESSTGLI